VKEILKEEESTNRSRRGASRSPVDHQLEPLIATGTRGMRSREVRVRRSGFSSAKGS
jgi:hypothetical protein